MSPRLPSLAQWWKQKKPRLWRRQLSCTALASDFDDLVNDLKVFESSCIWVIIINLVSPSLVLNGFIYTRSLPSSDSDLGIDSLPSCTPKQLYIKVGWLVIISSPHLSQNPPWETPLVMDTIALENRAIYSIFKEFCKHRKLKSMLDEQKKLHIDHIISYLFFNFIFWYVWNRQKEGQMKVNMLIIPPSTAPNSIVLEVEHQRWCLCRVWPFERWLDPVLPPPMGIV